MQLFAALFALLALAAIPIASAATWNDMVKVWDIGRVATVNFKGRLACTVSDTKTRTKLDVKVW
jgi:hypothetical protein